MKKALPTKGAILRLYSLGKTTPEICAKFNISRFTLWRITGKRNKRAATLARIKAYSEKGVTPAEIARILQMEINSVYRARTELRKLGGLPVETKYNPGTLQARAAKARGLRGEGWTPSQIAEFLGVSLATAHRYVRGQ